MRRGYPRLAVIEVALALSSGCRAERLSLIPGPHSPPCRPALRLCLPIPRPKEGRRKTDGLVLCLFSHSLWHLHLCLTTPIFSLTVPPCLALLCPLVSLLSASCRSSFKLLIRAVSSSSVSCDVLDSSLKRKILDWCVYDVFSWCVSTF